jgi:hypothetical protein
MMHDQQNIKIDMLSGVVLYFLLQIYVRF